jgi:trehalose 6-phosphate synthase/phosphatase
LRRQAEQWKVSASSGGLVTAMDPILKQTNGLWIGWPGDSSSIGDSARQEAIDAWSKQQRYVIVDIPQKTAELYYEGYSNQTIWPLFHYFPSLIHYDPKGWNAYVEANKRFRDAVLKQVRPNDLIWVHDYQLMLLPQMLRDELPDAKIGFFLHIPFPSSEVFRLLPGRDELLLGLLGSDLIAFHTHAHLQHFRSALLRLGGYDSQIDKVEIGGRAVRLEALPIGIAPEEFVDLRENNPETADFTAQYEKRFQDRRILFSVDRLDYTKGIPERLRTYRRLLQKTPKLRGRVVLIQVAIPSREKVASYARLRREVNEMVGEINGQFASPDWTPIVYVHRGISRAQLVALYAMADVGWVTPLRDGMNLVAKEYVACNRGHGVLVLSELAGAAAEMGEAFLVNPFDIDRTADVIARALSLPLEERQERMEALRKRVEKNNVFKWGERFVNYLSEAAETRAMSPTGQPGMLDFREVTAAYSAATNRLLFLNYDGTLAAYTPRPEQAAPSRELLHLLERLSSVPGNHVALVSGRRRRDVERWFGGIRGLCLAAEHGAWMRPCDEIEWVETHQRRGDDWKTPVLELLDHFVARAPGSLVEEKENSVVWHYRMTHPEFGDWLAGELLGVLEGMLSETEVNAVLGQKCVEIRPLWVHKGQVVEQALLTHPGTDFRFAVGDDRTDEDMFAALDTDDWTVRVGKGDTGARNYLPNPATVRALLQAFAKADAQPDQNPPAPGIR